jgi:cephalosporin hydroxylase/ketosteroid isomerase-like protein
MFDQLRHALEALRTRSAAPLLAFLAADVDWLVDWKGEGSFSGGPMHGRRRCRGRDAVASFFAELYESMEIRAVEIRRCSFDEDEMLLVGRLHLAAHGGAYTSDLAIRWVLRDGLIAKGNFLVLPDTYLASFIPDYETSVELDTEYIRQTIRNFQKLYLDSYLFGKTWTHTYWRGVPLYKCPLDLWVYQELIHELKPDLIVETGTCAGRSALFMADICEMLGTGHIITYDALEHEDGQPPHDRITYLVGSSISDEIAAQVEARVPAGGTVMVMLDSDHRRDHVLEELHIYSRFVSRGSYLIVEDSFLNGHPVRPDYGPGPMEAIDDFLAESDRFVIDREREKFLMTFNPRGYLHKIRD